MLFYTFCSLFSFILIIINFLYCLALPPPPEFSRVQLDCHRIPSSFCCSNRIRSNCAQLCGSLPTSTASCLSSAFPSSSSSKLPTVGFIIFLIYVPTVASKLK
uniref:Candidate secreted effector n=1 Tax=Meloidogyne incognita TaxID=6306 RepID=A0A914KMJ3_MELIC